MWRKIMVFVTALKTQTNLQMCTQKTLRKESEDDKQMEIYIIFIG